MAVLTTVYLINRTPSRILHGTTPLQIIHTNRPLFSLLPRVFGCTCFVQDHNPTHTKLDNKSVKCIFLGYSALSKGYRCYDPVSRHTYHSVDHVTFCEDLPFYSSNPILQDPVLSSSVEESTPSARPIPILDSVVVSPPSLVPEAPLLQTPSQYPRSQFPLPEPSLASGLGTNSPSLVSSPPRYPRREHHPPSRYGWLSSSNYPISHYVSYDSLSDFYRAFLGKLESVPIPRSVSQALQNPKWVTTMQTEMAALEHNHTWELVPLPVGEKTVGCKWVYSVK